jgi:histidyl-tRNA synthetase
MEENKIQTLKGFSDYIGIEAKKRNYAVKKFKETFELFGFEPLETPALEYKEVLLNKYGEEADKLVYTFKDKGERDIALRYDQTVPTARVMAMYRNNIPMPWRRYQIQPAWRAENPQKGRKREFLQCDIDIYGSSSALADAEILATSWQTLNNLGFENFTIEVNDRNILFKIMKASNVVENLYLSTIQTLDKLDKKEKSEIVEELEKKGVKKASIDNIFEELDKADPTEEIQNLITYSQKLGVEKDHIEFTPTLARGLDYYTGVIFEIKIEKYKAGSVAGGGRYDNLIERLSGFSIPAVGIAFGFDRIIEAMDELNLFPKDMASTKVLVITFGSEITKLASTVVKNLRENKIPTEIFPDENSKLEKQVKYADKKNIPWVIFVGPDEIKKNKVVLKNMKSGHQEDVSLKKLLSKIKN